MQHISVFPSEPQLDTMPVFKTTEYPWTNGSFRPLAYARMAFVESGGLLVDLQAFERDPWCEERDVINNSCVSLSLCIDQDSQTILTVVLNAGGRYQVFEDGQEVDMDLDVTCYGGDDEQGWYWGVRFYLYDTELPTSVPKMAAGHIIKGNIYKFKRFGSDAHMGAVAPMKDESIFAPENLEAFRIVDF